MSALARGRKRGNMSKITPLDISILPPSERNVNENQITYTVTKAAQQKKNAEQISKYLSIAYAAAGQKSQALRATACGTFLMFKEYNDPAHTSELYGANFCKSPLCPMCAWRKHLQTAAILQNSIEKREKSTMLYHLVLAIPNVRQITKQVINNLKSSAIKFIKKELTATSYFLRLEITYSETGYHPHLHILLEHDFITVTEEYIKNMSQLWKSYNNNTDKKYSGYTFYLRGVVKSNELDVIQELTKYVLKPDKTAISYKVIDDTLKSISHLKKFSSGGNIKNLMSQAKKQSILDVDRKLRELKPYEWQFRIFEYVNGYYEEKTKQQQKEVFCNA